MFIVKRIEGGTIIRFLDSNGTFGKREDARLFETAEEANDRIELEKDDPLYDTPYMEKCEFIVEEA